MALPNSGTPAPAPASLYARVRHLCCSSRAPPPLSGPPAKGAADGGKKDPMPHDEHGEEGACPVTSAAALQRAKAVLGRLQDAGLLDGKLEQPVGLVYDETMLLHCGPANHPEQPARIREIHAQLEAAGLLRACTRVPSREATEEELRDVHAAEYVERVLQYSAGGRRKTKAGSKAYSFPFGADTYVCEHSIQCARLAAGCPLALIDASLDPSAPTTCGMAIIRPPGHHATKASTSGFCIFNNVAVAARYAQKRHGLARVAIIDWDVHHGNGTNDIFTEDASVLFFSMHRWDSHGFFPGTGFMEDVGHKEARGYSINVPLDKNFSDVDVSYVFRYVLCPALKQFQPEAIFVSAGFDAVRGDPLGECKVTPRGFAWMTRALHRLANHLCEGRLYLLLEGGYNPDAIAQCCVECVQAMVLEAHGISEATAEAAADGAFSKLPSPAQSARGTPTSSPAMSPKMSPKLPPSVSLTPSTDLGPAAASPPSSPQLSCASPSHAPSSPSGAEMARPKSSTVSAKTVKAVRKLTELHNFLDLRLPLAPKEVGAPANKNARKNEKRRLKKHNSGSGAEDDASNDTDSSAWAIACGCATPQFSEAETPRLSDAESLSLPSPMSTPKMRPAAPPATSCDLDAPDDGGPQQRLAGPATAGSGGTRKGRRGPHRNH